MKPLFGIFSSDRGFSLIELLVTIALIGVLLPSLITFTGQVTTQLTDHFQAIHGFHLLHQLRSQAKATDRERTLHSESHSYVIKEGQHIVKTIPIDASPSISNSNKIGFNRHGQTKHSATISFSRSSSPRKVSLGIGHGKISLK